MNKYRKRRITGSVITIMVIIGGTYISLHDMQPEDSTTTQIEDVEIMELTTSGTTPYIPGSRMQPTEVTKVAERTIDGLPICPECGQIIQHPTVPLTHAEKVLLYQAVDVETPGCSADCKKGVASVILNRMYMDHLSLTDVIYAEDQFGFEDLSEVFPCGDTINAVNEVLEYGVIFPKYVTFFCGGEYHEWGDLKPFIRFDNTYFSYSASVREEYESSVNS